MSELKIGFQVTLAVAQQTMNSGSTDQQGWDQGSQQCDCCSSCAPPPRRRGGGGRGKGPGGKGGPGNSPGGQPQQGESQGENGNPDENSK